MSEASNNRVLLPMRAEKISVAGYKSFGCRTRGVPANLRGR